MIREIAVQLRAAISAKGCPVPVVDDHEGTTTTTYARTRIVVADDDERGDQVGSARGVHRNPRVRFTASEGARVTIYAQAPGEGAPPWEHRRYARKIRDLVLVELDTIIRARRNAWTIGRCGFEKPADLAASERPRGAVYAIELSYERAVQDHSDWRTALAPEFTLTDDNFESTTLVVGDPNTPDASAATGCGS